ncbi:MAG TPA: hypothetical protein VII94_00010 [Candidatus Saccharimonadales bacterium]
MFRTKNKNSSAVHTLGLISWIIFFSLVSRHPSFAANTQIQQSTVQSYGTSEALRPGIVVQIDPKNIENVIPASQSTITRTFGVVVNPSLSAIAVNKSTSSSNSAYVSSDGNYQMIVSDQNGPITLGDYLTLSAVDGIAMKDNSIEPVTVGQASSSFNGTSGVIGTEKLPLSNNSYQTVHFGIIYASVSIAHNPLIASENSVVPSFLVDFSKGVVGRTVSAWRIYVALIITLAICVIVGSMLYGAVKSSLTAIGRNPLSKNTLFKGFIQSIISAVIIFISGLFLVYLLLKV